MDVKVSKELSHQVSWGWGFKRGGKKLIGVGVGGGWWNWWGGISLYPNMTGHLSTDQSQSCIYFKGLQAVLALVQG